MSLGELLLQGGLMMIPIYACSVIAMTVFIYKMLEFRKARLRDLDWVEPLLHLAQAQDFARIRQEAEKSVHPAARVIAAMARAKQENPQQVASEAKRVGSLELQRLEKHISILSFLAEVAPLLGLLGTVIGMVDMFMALQGASHSSVAVADLASGIWKALLTTAAGLCVAVPALAAHRFLASAADGTRLTISDVSQKFIYAIGELK